MLISHCPMQEIYSTLDIATIDLGTLSSSEHCSEGLLQQKTDRRPIEKDESDINFVSEEIYSMIVSWDTLTHRTNVEIGSISSDGFSKGNSEIVYEPARKALISADPLSPPSRFKRSSKRTIVLSKESRIQ